ncbi:DUF4998 domain-containing protein [Niabella hibiscisoli]|uniref:DUF4998 domain-containing protein n=1 Tax=Niabella hibiscisoli TaxID=1825928 RepID=UPI001F0DB773|nr:DUF4998 domain-containing protein [Niabella hibiscisoli]MCH5718247.1 DUF4998 domain-containing protein [Niabella hibiscisoli]
MKYLIYIFIIGCVLTGAASCDKFTDVHKEFIKDGETVYAVKPDSVAFVSGKQRLKMRLWMVNGINVKEVVVSWNSGADSLVVPVSFKAGRDSMEVLLTGLEEKSYAFNIYSIDNFKNRSLIYTQFGAAYGSLYASTLVNRRVRQVSLTEAAAVIEWFAGGEGMIVNEIKYISKFSGLDTVLRYREVPSRLRLMPRPGLLSSIVRYLFPRRRLSILFIPTGITANYRKRIYLTVRSGRFWPCLMKERRWGRYEYFDRWQP